MLSIICWHRIKKYIIWYQPYQRIALNAFQQLWKNEIKKFIWNFVLFPNQNLILKQGKLSGLLQ